MFRLFFVFFVFVAGCWLCVCNLFRMLWQSVRNVVAICTPRIHNPFRMHSRNVRNVFVICVLHIRHGKVWFLRHKSMVFSVQKPPFYIAKRGFLFFAIMVDGFADAGKRFYFAGVVGCVIVTSMQLFWSIRLRRVVRMSSQVIFSTM